MAESGIEPATSSNDRQINQLSHQAVNVRLMVEAMNEMDVTFNESDVVHNVMSRCVLENDHGLLNICELGRAAEDTFVTERILGDEPVWSPMKKLKLYLFRDSVKAVKV